MEIVLAVDGSPSAVEARDLVAGLPWPADTTITLVMSFHIPSSWLGDPQATGAWLPDMERSLESEAEAELARLARPLEGHGWHVGRRAVPGRAADEILAVADEMETDLIVLGSRGHGAIQSMLLGSTSAEVAEQARCSVLVARGDHVSRLLVATDGSECSLLIPEVIGEWAALRDLPAVALSVTPVDSPGFKIMVSLYTLGDYPLEQEQAQLHERHRAAAEAMATGLAAVGIPASAEVRDGDAANEIIAAAAAAGADLVVTGSHGMSMLDRWLLGSVARDVLLHTDSSVLLVRRPAEQPAA